MNKYVVFLGLITFISSNSIAEVRLGDINLPPGSGIEIHAEVPNARSLSPGSDGVVYRIFYGTGS